VQVALPREITVQAIPIIRLKQTIGVGTKRAGLIAVSTKSDSMTWSWVSTVGSLIPQLPILKLTLRDPALL
jgi:hypothetical protein